MKVSRQHTGFTFCAMLFVLNCCLSISALAQSRPLKIVVDIKGRGNYKSIQAAINSLPDSAAAPRIIFIKKGVYTEKIYIEKQNIILQGEDRTATIITQAIARDQWRCIHRDDWGVATINIDGNDVGLMNLTVTNSFGFDWKKETIISCPADTTVKQKKLTKAGHQMALRTMNGTRIKAIIAILKLMAATR